MRGLLVLIGALLVLCIVDAAYATTEPPLISNPFASTLSEEEQTKLASVASVFAMREVRAECLTREAWNSDSLAQGSWGYVLGPDFADSTSIAPLMCEGAARVTDESLHPWQRAYGVMVLVHESYHLRHWRHNHDEGRVNCQAIRHFKVGVQLLGGTKELADRLLPYALDMYWRTAYKTRNLDGGGYHWSGCKVPKWFH